MRNTVLKFIFALSGGLLAFTTSAAAQDFLGEQTFRCLDFEVEVWGEYDRVTIFRNEGDILEIPRGEPVMWFCGRDRIELKCHRDADLLDVFWDGEGIISFQCLRR